MDKDFKCVLQHQACKLISNKSQPEGHQGNSDAVIILPETRKVFQDISYKKMVKNGKRTMGQKNKWNS